MQRQRERVSHSVRSLAQHMVRIWTFQKSMPSSSTNFGLSYEIARGEEVSFFIRERMKSYMMMRVRYLRARFS